MHHVKLTSIGASPCFPLLEGFLPAAKGYRQAPFFGATGHRSATDRNKLYLEIRDGLLIRGIHVSPQNDRTVMSMIREEPHLCPVSTLEGRRILIACVLSLVEAGLTRRTPGQYIVSAPLISCHLNGRVRVRVRASTSQCVCALCVCRHQAPVMRGTLRGGSYLLALASLALVSATTMVSGVKSVRGCLI
jgi:hypothetical protein